MLSPLHLRTLVEVVRTGSFAQAAKNLSYTASAVSQQMAALERSAHLTLFERGVQGVQLRAEAEILARHAQDVLADMATLQVEVQDLIAGRSGRVRIGSFPTASARLLPGALASFHAEFPAVQIRLVEAEPEGTLASLQLGELDVALVYRYELVPKRWPRRILETGLLTEELVMILPEEHPSATGEYTQLEDFQADTWVAPIEGTAGATSLVRACASAGFEPHVAFRSNNYGVIQGLVSAGLGVALIPTLGYDASKGGSRVLRLVGGPRRSVVALRHDVQGPRPQASAIAAFHEAAANLAKEQVPAGTLVVSPRSPRS